MKKLLIDMVIVSMLASFLTVPASVFAKTQDFIIAESYNNQVTGSVPGDGAKASGLAKIVEKTAVKDKAVEMAAGSGESSISYSINAVGSTLSMYVDLIYTNKWSRTEFYILDSTNKKFVIAYIDEDGQIYSGDSRFSTVVPKNYATSIQLTYNMKYKKASIYLGKKQLENYRYLGKSALDNVSGFGIGVSSAGKDASLLVDNFAIYEGASILKSEDIPKKSYNSEAYTIADSDSSSDGDEIIGDTVFLARNFEEESVPTFDGIYTNTAGNKIDVTKSVLDGNSYIKITKQKSEASYISVEGSKGSRYIVMDFDVSTDNNTPAGRLLFIRDGEATSMFNTFLKINSSGDITTADGKFVNKVEARKWINVAVVADSQALTYDIYTDGKLIYENIPFENKTITCIPVIRIGFDNGSDRGTLFLDNIKVYEGKEPREVDGSVRRSVVTPTSIALGYIGSNKVVYPFNSTIYTDKQKRYTLHEIIRENENTVLYAHKEDLKTLFGDDLKLGTAHREKADYYNIEETGINSLYQVRKMDTRLMIFSRSEIDLSDEKLAEINRFMAGVRPNSDELTKLYEANGKNEHPRVLINKDDIERIKSLSKTDQNMIKWRENVIAAANAMFAEPDYQYLPEGTGLRDVDTSYDDILNICMAYLLTDNERYAARAWKFIENICELDNWNGTNTYLDVGELSFIVGLGYDWIYDALNDRQKKLIEETLYKRGVEYTLKVYYNDLEDPTMYTSWWSANNNWNAVCNGGTICGAVALMDVYPEVCTNMIENALRGLEYLMPVYYPMGAWEEGGTYWRYALSYLLPTVASLRNAFGTDFDLMKTPGIDNTGWYGTYLAGATGMITIGDSSSYFENNPHILYLAKEFRDEMLMAARLQEIEKFGHKAGTLEMIYYDPELYSGAVKVPLDTLMPGMEVISLRESWYDKGATYLGASGGNNNRGHGHMDIGSFVIDMGGERFIDESGSENYNASGYFNKNRYYFYRSRPEGHNLYVINYEDSLDYFGMDPNASAKGELLVSKPRGSIGVIDLSDAYAEWTNSARRGYMLSDDRRSATIRDEISLKQADSEIQWFLHTEAKIESVEGNKAVLSMNGKKMLITVATNASQWEFKEVDPSSLSTETKKVVKDTNNASAGLKKLALVVKGSGDINITAKFKQYDDDMIKSEPTNLSIDEWTIPDGEVTPLPEVKAIYIDGVLVEDFDPLVTGYAMLMSTKETRIPVVTAEADTRLEVTQATDFGEDSIIRVYDAVSDTVYRTYRVNFYKLPPLKDIDGMRRYPVAKVTASAEPQVQNGAINVIDEDFGTRWSAEGKLGQWVMLELDDIYPIEKVGVSWMNGDVRATTYKIEVSVDGINWTTIFNGVSSGTTTKCEYTNANGAMAKFVRCTGYGNSLNEWNSVTELEVLGNQR